MSTGQASGINPTFFDQVAQIAHFFTTYGITFTFGVFGGWKWLLAAFIGSMIYAGVHEFWWDPREENAATRGSDLQDFCFLTAGALVGSCAAIFAIKHLA